MRIFLLLILILVAFTRTYSQREFIVIIVDKEENKPIPFAILTYYNSGNLKGSYSNALGLVKVNMPNIVDSIKISCIGYRPFISFSTEVDDTIKLEKETYLLQDIVIRPFKKQKYQIVGFSDKAYPRHFAAYSGIECAVYIKNEAKDQPFIKSILYRIKIRGDFRSVIRIHLYTCNNIGLPDKELINENHLVYLTKKDDGLIEVDISKFGVKMPLTGIFVGMEWIGTLDENTNRIIENDRIPNVKKFGYETYISLISSDSRELTYIRSVNEKKDWKKLWLNLSPNIKLNAAFGLKLQKI